MRVTPEHLVEQLFIVMTLFESIYQKYNLQTIAEEPQAVSNKPSFQSSGRELECNNYDSQLSYQSNNQNILQTFATVG